MAAMSSTARSNAKRLAFDGLSNPLSFRTNWSDAARISSSVAGGSKLKSVLMLLHMAPSPLNRVPLQRITPGFTLAQRSLALTAMIEPASVGGGIAPSPRRRRRTRRRIWDRQVVKARPGIAALAGSQMSLTIPQGAAAEHDRGNRIFVLVGPPAEEPRPSDK